MGYNFIRTKMQEDKRPPKEKLLELVQTRKLPNKRMKTTYSFLQPAALQNTLDVNEWKKGDPNDETFPEYDMIWIVWVLRHVFPKDVVTHFMNLMGGMSFTVIREPCNNAGKRTGNCLFDVRLELSFWNEGNMSLYGVRRRIYFNLPIEKIKKEKDRTYIQYKEGNILQYRFI
jgi:hypothetical protein